MFDQSKCNLCGECLARCAYVDYDMERGAAEIKTLIGGEKAPILSSCITCYACNEYCPTQARPFDLIIDRMEQYRTFPAPEEYVAKQEQIFAIQEPAQYEETADLMLSACVFSRNAPELFEGSFLAELPAMRGRHFFCYVMFDHLGRGSITRANIRKYVDSLAKSGAKEIVMFHDDCYGALVDLAPSLGIEVPFKPVHIIEYLRDWVAAHKEKVQPLGLKVSYQRPCASRLSPQTEPALDHLFDLIGVKRAARRYDREGSLCCSAAINAYQPERGAEIRARNIRDAVDAGAQAMAYLCPVCRRTLTPDAEASGLGNYHITELVRMAIGELPVAG